MKRVSLDMAFFVGLIAFVSGMIIGYNPASSRDMPVQPMQVVTITATPTSGPRILNEERAGCDLFAHPVGESDGFLECQLAEFDDFVGYTFLLKDPSVPVAFSVSFTGTPVDESCAAWMEKEIEQRAVYLMARCGVEFEGSERVVEFEIPLGQALLASEATPAPTGG